MKLLDLHRLQQDMTGEIATLQRLNDQLKEENARMVRKQEGVLAMSEQQLKEIDKLRKQVSDLMT